MKTGFPVIAADPGVTRQVLSHGPELMVVAFRFETGAAGKRHHHPHVQSTYVESGQFEFTIEDVVHQLGPGNSIIIPSNAWHGCVCIAKGVLIDNFTPRREDFL